MVRFRPTRTQALGRGTVVGGLAGLVVTAVSVMLSMVGVFAGSEWASPVPAFAGAVGGGCLGLLWRRWDGADVDHRGIHPAGRAEFTPWQRVAGLRAERRSGRIRVAVYFDTGQVERLGAPYSGRWLGADPEFERKLFTLRGLWLNHRNYAITRPEAPDDGLG